MDEDTAFRRALEHVLVSEGGYVDHPDDPGGATNMGITRKTLARWRQISPWWALPKSAVRDLEGSEAARIYRSRYWSAASADRMPAGIGFALFDFAVNSGVGRAARSLQTILGVKRDGIVGPLTLAALHAFVDGRGEPALVDRLCDDRLGFLRKLAAFAVFGRGWLNRVKATREAALALCKPFTAREKSSIPRRNDMSFLAGYRTYLVALIMALTGIAQILGVEVPAFDPHAGGQLLMEALAILFLRRGLNTEIGNA
ncbi:glycoside hydrolase family 108 protein [Cucumibacter marinus]|uniref:glycoside hydrolase family 108 protein n=1 Tax=Cucumibacter marinus TaxID=1121252 RepID=UPI00040E8E26|nr:glycosyl hydrolase 108 family protein [Cucumibacter marinus]